MSLKRMITNAVLLVTVGAAASALPPSLLLGAYMEGGASSLLPSSAVFTDARLQGSFGWRQALGPGSYLAVAGRAGIAPYLTTLPGFVDDEFFNIEVALPSAASSLIFDVGMDSSMMNQTGVGSYAQPAWSAEYRCARGDGGVQPSLGYQGSYLSEQLGSDDHLSQVLFLTLDDSTTVRLGGFASLRGGWELWTKEQAYEGGLTPTGAPRQDWHVDLSAGARGFALYSVDWKVDVSGGVRFSDAGILAASYSPLALPGGSRLNAGVNGSVSWTPNRHVSLGFNGALVNDWYLARMGVNPDGTASTVNLNVLSAEGGVRLDWTPDNAFFLVIRAAAGRTFANDASVASWNGTISAGVEYSF